MGSSRGSLPGRQRRGGGVGTVHVWRGKPRTRSPDRAPLRIMSGASGNVRDQSRMSSCRGEWAIGPDALSARSPRSRRSGSRRGICLADRTSSRSQRPSAPAGRQPRGACDPQYFCVMSSGICCRKQVKRPAPLESWPVPHVVSMRSGALPPSQRRGGDFRRTGPSWWCRWRAGRVTWAPLRRSRYRPSKDHHAGPPPRWVTSSSGLSPVQTLAGIDPRRAGRRCRPAASAPRPGTSPQR